MKKGIVYLIGAGPGDAGLFTLRGKECLEEADVVIYDYLVNHELLGYCRSGALKIYVGKMADKHTASQDEINAMLVEHALAGNIVARLKGGDPFIFGRGGEEALELAARNIAFEIVPGIPAAIGAAAYAGIPLTHRDYASSVAFITGHSALGKETDSIRWEKIATGIDTLVFYMGVKNLDTIVSKLIEHGRPAHAPCALISWGTLNCQQTLSGPLDRIAGLAERAGLSPPALIIVGDVTSLRPKLRWFDTRALAGKKIIVTRTRYQASRLCARLSHLGAQVVELPTIEIEPFEDLSALDRELGNLGSYSHIVFTSTNGVRIFFDRLLSRGYDSRALSGIEIIVIGSETGRALSCYGLHPDLVPESFTSEGTIAAIRSKYASLEGKNVLLPGSAIARDHIPIQLKELGANITIVPIYGNSPPAYDEQAIDELFGDSAEAFFTFTSSSTVTNLVSIFEKNDRLRYLPRIRGFSIGPVTSATARESGIAILREAETQTIESLVEKISDYFKE